jgi:hypothetical protein|tara:strand:+ start:387 stop:617 length:231 start_codon:yes stop_codon:yes gene_type:complete
MITKDTIEERKETITNDIQIVKDRLLEYNVKIKEDTALINALTGALQQCDHFLKELNDDTVDSDDQPSDVENSPED